jgi:4-hydroxybenzoate polyprenyltransferase
MIEIAPAADPQPPPSVSLWRRLVLTLRMIRFSHSIFALPFALLAAVMAAGGIPPARTLVWIVPACVFARSAAMAFNRLMDERFDRLNPRTSGWELPAGLLSRQFVWTFCVVCGAAFVGCAWMLNTLAFCLAPVALAIVFAYSLTKRWTRYSHFFLGLALGIVPTAAWVGVTGAIGWPPVVLGAAVLCWVAGFDIIYSCQDVAFDRRIGLHSLPSRLGVARALAISALSHAGSLLLFAAVGIFFGLGVYYFAALALAAVLLAWEQSLISPRDMRRLNMAFFTLNGWVSVLMFAGGLADVLLA